MLTDVIDVLADPFNGKLRDELLNGDPLTLNEANIVIEGWRRHARLIAGYRLPR